MQKFQRLTSRLVPLPAENVDTDQIIPARFLKVTDKKGLGENLFCDWRYAENGDPNPDFVLNKPEMARRSVLLAGNNFGCGSSREHAPWALADFGFRAIISTQFADIFRNNSLKNGLLPILVDKATHVKLFALVKKNSTAQVTIDLESQTLTMPDGSPVRFPIDSFSKKCLLEGLDDMGYLLNAMDKIKAFEQFEQ